MPLTSQAIRTSSYCKNERDGIKAWYDVYNTKSYGGSGTTIVDATSNGAPSLTVNGGSSFSSTFGGNFSFDGTDDYISSASNTYFEFMKNASFSIDIWFRPDMATPPSQQTIFSCTGTEGSTTRTDIHLRIYDTGLVRFAYYADDLDTATGLINFTGNGCDNWHNIVCTYNNSTDTTKIYVNGFEEASGSQGPFIGSAPSIGIGAWQNANVGNGQYSKGKFQALTLYNKALSSTDVLQNYYSRYYRLVPPCL